MADKKRYSDIDLDLTPHPVSGDVVIKYDEEAVKRSIRNLVQMGIHEKPFHPEIRSEVRKLLFENFTTITAFEIEKEIEDIIREYEPRATVKEINVIQDDAHNRLDVTIKFKVVGMPSLIYEMTLPLERIR